MRIFKVPLLLILMFLMLGMKPFPVLANATQSGKIISQTIESTREVITDNLALSAEVSSLNETLLQERKATQDLIYSYNKYTDTSKQEITLLRENNGILTKQLSILEKKNKQAEVTGWIKLVLGVAIGVAVSH